MKFIIALSLSLFVGGLLVAPAIQAAPALPATAAPAVTAKPQVSVGQQEIELSKWEQEIVTRTNLQRARYGLHPLRIDFGLLRSARRHAQWMTRNNSMQHSSGVAENIAMGQPSPTAVLAAWMNSSGHRANILNPHYTRIGIATYATPQGVHYYCQQFRR